RLTLGFTFLYWTTVGRAAGQVDESINPTQLGPGPVVGPPAPQFSLRTTDFWATGVNMGLEYQF
ncbi:MAG: BBP7 family outer membrane beta-barrel protein, partial [Actinomycetota bacterium]